MQYRTLTALLAMVGSTSATMMQEQQQQYGGDNKMMGGEQKQQQYQPPMQKQQQYQPPPGSCWQGMQQSDMKQAGVVIISNNDGGMNNKWNMVSDKSNYMQSMGQTWQVTVGGSKGLVFDPPTVNAKPGDMVQFNFMDKNHTVTQSTFDKPCVKMMGGMDSGFMPNPNNTINPAPAMKVQVMDTKPMWFYCKQKMPKPHCGSGMGFSINPTMDKSQQKFIDNAKAQNGTGSMMAPPMGAPPSAVATPQSNVVQGMGSMQNGQCTCSCLCGTGAYAAGLGIGQMGGLGGMLPMSPGGSSGGAPMPAMPAGAPAPSS